MDIPGFNAAEVKAGLALAMSVGIPVDPANRLSFDMPSVHADWVDGDGEPIPESGFDDDGVPFDPQARQVPGTGVSEPVTEVTYGVEYQDKDGQTTRLGDVAVSHLIVTLFDEEYAKVQGCVSVTVAGERYMYARTEIPAGLGTVTFYRMHFDAVREQ